jgi:hypothetical protein
MFYLTIEPSEQRHFDRQKKASRSQKPGDDHKTSVPFKKGKKYFFIMGSIQKHKHITKQRYI